MSRDRILELEDVLRTILESIRYWKSGVLSTPPSVLLDTERLIILALEGSESKSKTSP